MWAKVGIGASVKSEMGHWSSVGPMSKVWSGVKFGNWSTVGMCSVVMPGVVMDAHEHLPSGHLITVFGKVRLPGYDAHRSMYQLWDRVASRNGPSVMTHEDYADRERCRAEDAYELAEMLRQFLVVKGVNQCGQTASALSVTR